MEKDKILRCISSALTDAGINSGAQLLVGLSGGADSTALLVALRELGYGVEALHCNFELRGRESDGDEARCRALCRQHNVGLHVRHFRTQAYARRNGVSVEMAARRLRYEWFAEMSASLGAAAVCVGHHRDDNVETLLLNLVRGTGLRGLTGMRPVRRMDNGLVVLRPLLEVARADIEAWLQARDITWCTDSTNLDPDAAQRNSIRLQVVPLLERLHTGAAQRIAATAQRLSEAEALYDDALARATESVVHTVGKHKAIDVQALMATPAPRTVLHELLSPYGFHSAEVADIFAHLDGDAGHVWHSSSGTRVLRDRGNLLIENDISHSRVGDESDEVMYLPLEGLATTATGTRIMVRRMAVGPDFVVPREAATVCLDLHKLTLPLVVRRVASGDRFRPFGMTGTRLVSDYLTDAKVSLFDKERQLVVCSGDKIVWLVGHRAADGFAIDSHSRHAMTLTVL